MIDGSRRRIAEILSQPSTADVNQTLSNTEVDRGNFWPAVEYADGRLELGWPEALPMHRLARLMMGGAREAVMSPLGSPEMGQAIEDGLGVAGMAALGSVVPTRPANSLGMFAGQKAKTADMDALARAQAAEESGVPREQIWNDTGWFKGVDGKWRFEIDDSNSRLLRSTADIADSAESVLLSNFYDHGNLYSAYPHLADTRFTATSHFKPGEGFYGSQTLGDGIQREIIAAGYGQGKATQSDLGAVRVLPHEIQHAIQGVEQMAQGGRVGKLDKTTRDRLIQERMKVMEPIARAQGIPLDAMRKVVAKEINGPSGQHNAYKRLAGEVEARAVQKRLDLTADERRARAPWLDYDVPESDQIVRYK